MGSSEPAYLLVQLSGREVVVDDCGFQARIRHGS